MAKKKAAKIKPSPKTSSNASGPKKKSTPTAKKVAKTTTKTNDTTREANSGVKIRMYCQGLGDCFLVSFPRSSGGKPFYVLIDCGLFLNTSDDVARLTAVARDIAKVTTGKIDLLIITHEHWDHISGFSLANSVFATFKFKDVWLSWAENPSDAMTKQIKQSINKNRARVEAALKVVERIGGIQAITNFGLRQRMAATAELMGFLGVDTDKSTKASGRMSLGETMDWLRDQMQSHDFRKPGECLPLRGTNVKAYVLGPPRNEKSIRKMNPSGDQGYRHSADQATSMTAAAQWLLEPGNPKLPAGPFDDGYAISEEQARQDNYFREHYGFANDPLDHQTAQWRRIDDDWLNSAAQLALQLDVGVNNTSLALAFELADGRTLIFPGDAQIGNWLSWDDVVFKNEHGKKINVTSQELLQRAVFYKVGHHGSHNATRKVGGLESMTSGKLVAMIPTDQEFAQGKRPPKDGWKMPFDLLYKALKNQTSDCVARADFNEAKTKTSAEKSPAGLKFFKRLRFSKQPLLPTLKSRPLYIEYTLP